MPKKRRVAVMMDLDKPYKRHVSTFAGIHDYAQHAGWHLISNDWADRLLPGRPDQPVPFDGLIGRITSLGATRAKRLGLPVVNVWFNSPAMHALPGVFPDSAMCGRENAEHLLSRGFQNLGILSHARDRAHILESEAFEQTAREAKCRQLLPLAFNTGKQARMGIGALDLADYKQWKQAMRLIDQWMDRWRLPIGLYIFNITIARIIIDRCEDRGWRVPEDVAIAAGWNDEVQCIRPDPSISSLELPNEAIGYEAARMLDALIDEKAKQKKGHKDRKEDTPEPQKIFLPPVGVVARRSTDFHAVDDQLVRKALGYMDTNHCRPILIDDIADHVGVSRVTLTTRFREKLGRSINNELQRLRIERVKRELLSSDNPIYRIAPSAGFANVRTLNALFRKIVGCTPNEFRKRAEQSNEHPDVE